MKNILLTFIMSIFLINSSFSQISTEHQLKEANKAAITWLNNFNTYNYSLCWNGFSETTKIMLNSDSLDWKNGVDHMMIEFGEFEGRIEVSREFKSSLEGSPDGYYAIFQYESNYKNTSQHSEQLILHQNSNRKWKVLGFQWDYQSKNK